MKKYLYAFVGLCLCQSVYADPHGVYDITHVTGIVIPRPILVDVLIQDDLISQTAGAYENMLAKYDSLAGPFGQEQLSIDDITQICVASGVINTKEECFTRVLNPAFTKMGRVRFFDTCSGRITGGTNYCIDDVFQIGRSENGNPYHQDVNVSRNPAFGFAIEYAKKNGHDVWCSSETHDQAINCSTLDNQNFYTFKFAGLNNTSDSALIPSLESTSRNLIKGICALYDAEYSIGRISWDCKFDCRNGTDASKVIPKFGLSIHPASTENECMLSVPDLSPADVKKYPGYEYMTYAFKEIQTVLEPSLTKVLKTYVELQGISVQSFDCDYSPRGYHDEIQSGAWQGMPVSVDDALRCRINGTEVDFIFDDLFESKGYEQRAGQAGLQCILAGGNYGSDKNCRNLTRAQCTEANAVVPGGTDWDSRAEVCILRDAARARTISNTIQITGGVVLAVGITVASGGSATVALVAAAGSVVVDAAFIGYERLLVLNPAHRARQFADDVKGCHIPIEKTSCTPEQKTCATQVINEHFARLDEIMDQLNDDQLVVIGDLMENVADCLSDEELKSALTTSTPMFEDKLLSAGGKVLMAAAIFIAPEDIFQHMLARAPKMIRVLNRTKILFGKSETALNNMKHFRLFVDKLDNGRVVSVLNSSEIENLVEEIRRDGFYISSNITPDNRRFIAFSKDPVFDEWKGSRSNWLNLADNAAGMGDKTAKIRAARSRGDLGYHGTDEVITDYIRPSQNTSSHLGSVGYGIAEDFDSARDYAIRRLIERQNPGKNLDVYIDGNVLVIRSDEPLNLSRKECYVYTTAKESYIRWDYLRYSHGRSGNAAKMPNPVEVLDSKTLNLDNLINQGVVRIIQPSGLQNKVKNLLNLDNSRVVSWYGARLNNQEYVRVYVNGATMDDIYRMENKLRREGFFVSSGVDYNQRRQFIAVSDRNILGPLDNADNWLKSYVDGLSDQIGQMLGLDHNRVVSWYGRKIREKYVRIYVDGLSDAEINRIGSSLRNRNMFISSGIDYDNGKKFIAVSDKNILDPLDGADNWLKNFGSGAGNTNGGHHGSNNGSGNRGGHGAGAGSGARNGAGISNDALTYFKAKDSTYNFEMGLVTSEKNVDYRWALQKWGLSEDATADVIKQRFRDLSLKFHPDHNLDSNFIDEAGQLFSSVNIEKGVIYTAKNIK